MVVRTSIASAIVLIGLSATPALAQRTGNSGPGAVLQRENPNICGFRSCNSEAANEPFSEEIRNRRVMESRPRPASPADIAAGSQVRDRDVALIGTIDSVDASLAMVRFGNGRVGVPLSAFYKLDGHLVLPITRGEFNRIAMAQAARAENEATDDQAE